MYFRPRNAEIEKIINDLMRFRMIPAPPEIRQTLGRYKTIREINKGQKIPRIFIGKGIIGLSPNTRIEKKGNKYDIYDILERL